MKNLHLIPTEKPSRLYLDSQNNICFTDTEMKSGNKQNIYITSDEEVKKGDWIFANQGVHKVTDIKDDKYPYETFNYKGDKIYHHKSWKKIILTTDPDLIKDGIQSIDDEFLEWFVKNPSCESVETVIEKMFPMYESFPESINKPPFYGNLKYKIIIPQEEPKQETLETDKTNWKAVYEDSLNMQKCSNAGYESKIQELKQEIERMFSEEEVENIITKLMHEVHTGDVCYGNNVIDFKISPRKWFEQHKKK